MAKSTKPKTTIAKSKHIFYLLQQMIQHVTLSGKDNLADVEFDNNELILSLNADVDKVNTIKSNHPYIKVSESKAGKDPNKTKTIALDLSLPDIPIEAGQGVNLVFNEDTNKWVISLNVEFLGQLLAPPLDGDNSDLELV